MNDSFITVLNSASDEITIQKSRFIGYACPCASEEEAQQFIRKIREKHRDAKHHCYAYIIGQNSGIMRYSDDGEPGGTAGMPMMDILRSRQAVNCCVVVVRYFGGILLGTGGLVRAYTQGCKIALDAAGLVRMELSSLIQCKASYSCWNTVQYAVQNLPVQLNDIKYQDNVEFFLAARKKDTEDVIRKLKNISDGKMECMVLSEEYKGWTA